MRTDRHEINAISYGQQDRSPNSLWMRVTVLVVLVYCGTSILSFFLTHDACSIHTLNAASWLAWMVAQLSEHIYVQRLQNSS